MDLYDAVQNDDADGIRRAIAAGAKINAVRIDGITPLILAAAQGKTKSVRTLLELGADPTLESREHLTPMDFARGVGKIEIEDLLLAALRSRGPKLPHEIQPSPIVSGVARDLANFLDEADLVLPPRCLERLREIMAESIGGEKADEILAGLKKTGYRVLFEQLFAPEAIAVAFLSHGFTTIRSPMCIGQYDIPSAERRGLTVDQAFQGKFEITEALLSKLLPDELFAQPPKSICEIGGAWGATIAHLTRRFKPDIYHNYEPDRHFAEWTFKRYGAKKMPVDGETLSGTPDDSMDLVIANNVLVFVPPMKVWSYMLEMRRVIRKNGIILFNAVISDQITEEGLRHYLETSFPKRAIHVVPRDFIDRTFPKPQFETLQVYDREYLLLRRVT